MKAIDVAFLALLGVHAAHALVLYGRKAPSKDEPAPLTALVLSVPPLIAVCLGAVRRRAGRAAVVPTLIQTALFVTACYYGFRQGVFTRALTSPVHIGAGLLAGHCVFGLSLLLTHQSLRGTATHFIDFGSLWEFLVENPAVLLQFVTVAVAEELIYRVGAQPLLIQWTGSPALGIVVIAIGFSCVHEHFFRNPVRQSAEFLTFAFLLGILYYWTGSLILVIVIHAVRNIEIAFLEYLIRAEELGGEAQATREAELVSGERIVVLAALIAREIRILGFEYAGRTVLPLTPAPDAATGPLCTQTGAP